MTLTAIFAVPTENHTPMILAAASDYLSIVFKESGFHKFSATDALSAFDAAGLWIGPRATLEHMPQFRQIIPYVVIRIGDRILRYTRMPAGGEDRLHGKLSIGLGGHIDLSDIVAYNDCVDLVATLDRATHRELKEELCQCDVLSTKWVGVLVDNETEVGRVHIGIVGILSLQNQPVGTAADAIGDVALCTIDELRSHHDRLERWSAMVVDYLPSEPEIVT